MTKEALLTALEIKREALRLIEESGKVSREDYEELLKQKLGLLNPALLIDSLVQDDRLISNHDLVEIAAKETEIL